MIIYHTSLNSHKDKLKLNFTLNEIKKSCANKTILELPSEYIRKLNIFINILNNTIQRSHELDKKILNNSIN